MGHASVLFAAVEEVGISDLTLLFTWALNVFLGAV
jgi:hypothetical protein